MELYHHINQALKAHKLMHRDYDYVVNLYQFDDVFDILFVKISNLYLPLSNLSL